MNIGFVGLGKLGLPCAVAVAHRGHDVMGFDLRPERMQLHDIHELELGPDRKTPFADLLARSRLRFGTLQEVVRHADIVFIAVQTPHSERYEGIHRLDEENRDFDYDHLVEAVADVAQYADADTLLVVVSTVLPGTLRRRIECLVGPDVRICYNPSFIGMGTTMADYLQPEFVLIGERRPGDADPLAEFYRTVTDAPIKRMRIESAELTKVAYNTFIALKIAFANTLMEICEKIPEADVDEVTGALKAAKVRLLGPAYMDGGMGDGGGCHPRDNIAMSWLASQLDLSHNLFVDAMRAREDQTEWLADLMCKWDLPKAILGYAFKAGTRSTAGSPALLLRELLVERGHDVQLIDPIVDPTSTIDLRRLPPHVFLVGTREAQFVSAQFPPGSVVIDPWRFLPPTPDGVKLVSLGRGVDSGVEAPTEATGVAGVA